MITLKAGVRMKDLQPQVVLALMVAEGIYSRQGTDEMVVTSLNDSEHIPDSFHYKGLAVDLRVRNVQLSARAGLVQKLKEALGPEWDVLWENRGQLSEHIHLEFEGFPR